MIVNVEKKVFPEVDLLALYEKWQTPQINFESRTNVF